MDALAVNTSINNLYMSTEIVNLRSLYSQSIGFNSFSEDLVLKIEAMVENMPFRVQQQLQNIKCAQMDDDAD